MSTIPAKLRLVQNRVATLTDLLQDALHLSEAYNLPACNLHDLKRAIADSESIFYNLATIRTRLNHEADAPEP